MRRAPAAVLLAALLGGLLPLAGRGPAVEAAGPFVVDRTGNESDWNHGDGRCDAALFAPGDQCTLRAAIEEANTHIDRDSIHFAIPGPGPHTIRPTSSLPTITSRLTIDGSTQPGSRPNTLAIGTNAVVPIELDGSNGAAIGLRIEAPNAVVRGLAIARFGTGISVSGAAATGGLIQGCFVGTDAGGGTGGGNSAGVFVSDGASATVGGPAPAERNLISGNANGGVVLAVAGGGNVVQGNLIGTDKTGAGNLGNGRGVHILATSHATVGGGTAAAANVIAFNRGDGVEVRRSDAFPAGGNRILRNSIFANGGEGIDLGNDGRTANDPLDADTGPNSLQNWPALTAATRRGDATTVTGRLRSVPNEAFVVRVYSNPAGGEGKVYRGQLNVATNANGVSPEISFRSPTAIPVGHTVTATATRDGGDTSEFSPPRVVTAA